MQTIVQLPIASSAPEVELPLPEVVEYQPEFALLDTDLTKIQRDSLTVLSVFHHATADLILRKLKLSPKSIRHLQKNLSALSPKETDEKYVEIGAAPKPNDSRFGSGQSVYWLGKRGYKYLRQQGLPVGRYRQSDQQLHKSYPLLHRLAVNEFLLKAMLLEDEQGVYLLDRIHEKELNANPLKVKMLTDLGLKQVFDQHWSDDPLRVKELIEKGQATIRNLSSDLLLHFQIEQPRKQYIFLPEINLSPVWEKDWRDRIRAYLYSFAAYEERYGTKLLTAIPVMVASSSDFPRRDSKTLTAAEFDERKREAVGRKQRRNNLIRYTEAELTKLGFEHEADLFLFSSAPLDAISPFDLFFSPHWIRPFDGTPRALMEYEKRGVDDI